MHFSSCLHHYLTFNLHSTVTTVLNSSFPPVFDATHVYVPLSLISTAEMTSACPDSSIDTRPPDCSCSSPRCHVITGVGLEKGGKGERGERERGKREIFSCNRPFLFYVIKFNAKIFVNSALLQII